MAGLQTCEKAAEAAEVTAFRQELGPHQLRALARLDPGPAWLRGVCHDNAARLLGL